MAIGRNIGTHMAGQLALIIKRFLYPDCCPQLPDHLQSLILSHVFVKYCQYVIQVFKFYVFLQTNF
jgi:hypothetical protein